MIFDEARSHGIHEIPVEKGAEELSANITHILVKSQRNILHEHNQDLGQSIPIFVYANKCLTDRRHHMAGNKDAEYSDVDA